MIESISFKTRARTIDHLGREQIADCPTAISELWKNAFDAYARRVELNIFDDEITVATLVDNGHGMSRDEFENKWLTVGTETKLITDTSTEEDRDGLEPRQRQGQKGIGRLSCAALGSLLLLVSKRKDHPFVAALLDWRLFENPYLMLEDIKVPIVEFDFKHELFELLPEMFEKLISNIWGDSKDKDRKARLKAAWDLFDNKEKIDAATLTEIDNQHSAKSTRAQIEETIIKDCFTERHFNTWDVWTGISSKGTGLFIADLEFDLIAQTSTDSFLDDGPTHRAKERFRQTLYSYVDPYSRDTETNVEDFTPIISVVKGNVTYRILAEDKKFDFSDLENLEHMIEGSINEDGIFSGRVKTFGELYENITIKPLCKYKTRSDSRVGSFHIRLFSYEFQKGKTSMSDEHLAQCQTWSDNYGGVMIHRDGLRVMPYGREENDFFEIEKRRTKNAGRYFWSNRRTFGRIAISREANPNLKDKAGREGLIDNRASKIFKEIVENILLVTADRFLGSKSKIRNQSLEDIKKEKTEEKAERDRIKFLKNTQKKIRKNIKDKATKLDQMVSDLEQFDEQYSFNIQGNSLSVMADIKNEIGEYSAKLFGFSLGTPPTNLGSLKEPYRDYRRQELRAKNIIKRLGYSINDALSKFEEKSDIELLQEFSKARSSHLIKDINKLTKKGKELLADEHHRFDDLIKTCKQSFHSSISTITDDLQNDSINLKTALTELDEEFDKQDIENAQTLGSYVSSLMSIREHIDLEGLALHSINSASKMKSEVKRLNSLAQLGITVEIIGHEIEGLNITIERGLKALKNLEMQSHLRQSYDNVVLAHSNLSEKWRFLSPLKLSGEIVKKEITGTDIINYIDQFFGDSLINNQINLIATDAFKSIRIYEQPARLFPVFINIVNNARYWVCTGENENRQITLDFQNGEIVIADNGPGVDPDDIELLFTLFFTRKPRGGRGIGLYLCRTNLQAGGHTIRYENNEKDRDSNGAVFKIELRGVENV